MSNKLIDLCCFVLALLAAPIVAYGQAQNLLQNPSFEQDEAIQDDPDWAGWVTWNPAEGAGSNAAVDETDSIEGARSLRIDPRGGTNWYFVVLYADIPLEVGGEYTINFWAKAAVPRPINVQLKAMDNSVTWSGAQFDLTTDWVEYSVSGLALNELAKLEFLCATTNDTIWLDDVSLYAEGAAPAGPVNLALNGSFEEDEPILDDGSWLAWATWYPSDVTGNNVTIVDTESIDGARSLQVDPKGTLIVANISFPLNLGSNATATFWAKAQSPRPLSAQFKAADNSVTWGNKDFDLTSEWTEYSMTSAAQSDQGKLEFSCGDSEIRFWLDNVIVTAEEEPAPLVQNGSFEEDEVIHNDAAYDHWWTWGYDAGLASAAEIDDTMFVDGSRSLRIDPVGDTNWYFIVAYSPIMVEMDKNYTISFWAKAEEPRPLTAQLKATDNSVNAWGATEFQLTTEWAEYHYQSEVLIDNVKLELLCAGSEVPLWLDFVAVYEGDYVPGIEPVGSPKAGAPLPRDGAVDVARDVTLSWVAGNSAVTHDVYFGTSFDDVNDADVTGATGIYRVNQLTTSFTPAESPLDWGRIYYWRVDEVNDADPNSPWKGNVWGFTVTNHIVVDDFESYNDIPAGEEGSNLVYSVWADGFDNPAANGSTIGYPTGASMETDDVHGGDQAAPLMYDNSTAGISEVARTLNADWTQNEVLTLTLFYKGKLSNDAEPMHIALNGVAIYHDNPNAAKVSKWNQWDILLQDFADLGVDLTNVNTLTIGFGDKANPTAGGSGSVLIDDIRLYRSLPIETEPLPEPVDPGTANLVVAYSFEDNVQDVSGSGLDGTVWGNPFFVDGFVGKALSFDGVNDYVEVGNNAAFDITEQITISAWVNPNDAADGQHNPYVGKGDHAYALKHASNSRRRNLLHPDNGQVACIDRGSGAKPREKSFGQMAKLGRQGGNLDIWGPERFFSVFGIAGLPAH